MRMIDADALMKAMYHRAFETDGDTMWQSGCWVRYRAIEQTVKEQPTIERKTGQWLRSEFGVACNLCKRTQITMTPYCSHCGAEMDC